MSFFKGKYIRVTTPLTTNGVLPLIVDGQQQTEETHLPITAMKELEKKNVRLEKAGNAHLKMKLEVVNG